MSTLPPLLWFWLHLTAGPLGSHQAPLLVSAVSFLLLWPLPSMGSGKERSVALKIANLPKISMLKLIKRNEPIQTSPEITTTVSLW